MAVLSLFAAFSGVVAGPLLGPSFCPTAAAQSLTFISPPNVGADVAYSISADGTRVAAGGFSAISPVGDRVAYTWSTTNGATAFGFDPGVRLNSTATAISGDGQVIYGQAGHDTTSEHSRAFRWTGPGTYQELPSVYSFVNSYVLGASGDGAIAVGYARIGTNLSAPELACYWTGNTVTVLPTNITSAAGGISRDGSTIVGGDLGNNGHGIAVVWHPGQSTEQVLATLGNDPTNDDTAVATNADGSVIVGQSSVYPVRWDNGQITQLFRPSGQVVYGFARAVSDDGSVIVGPFKYDTPFSYASIWTQATGAIPLADYLAQNGVTLPAGITLDDVYCVSADGRTFGGHSSIGAFVATIPSPATLAVFSPLLLRRSRRRVLVGSRD